MATESIETDRTAPERPPRSSVFERTAGWSQRHRWWALAVWVALLAALTVGSQAVGPDYHNDFSLPGTDSQKALEVLRERVPAQSGASVQIVMQAPAGLADPAVRARIDTMLAEVQVLPHVTSMRDPFTDKSAISQDGTIGYATLALDEPSEEIPAEDARRIIDTAQKAAGDGLRVELSGDPIRSAQAGSSGAAEGIGILAALVILVLLFGSLVAASLPIIIAVFAVGSTLGLIVFASHLDTIANFTPPLMMLVGLGVGIDYALLIFSRFRSELDAGADRGAAVGKAIDTAGRTVFFAGCTVIVALIGLVVLGLGSLQGVAVAIALTVLLTMLASLTLLPALLAITGGRIERGVRKRAAKKGPREEGRFWARWTTFVQRHAWLGSLLPFAALVALTVPAANLYLGFADPGTDPTTSTTRKAYDLLAEGFGPGFNGPLIVVVQGGGQAAATAAQQQLATTAGIALASPPFAATGSDVSTILVFPSTAPQDEKTNELVGHLRDEVLPPVARSSGATFLVGGSTAAAEDFADAVAGRLPVFVLVVVGLSMLLLLAVFRSLLIPIKAAVLNLLSVGASMGVLTLIFQEGNLGVQAGPIEAYVPVMIFAIVFGLSMDYEVFLLARMHEEWERSHDAARAIRQGIATTGRVVTAAAAIMIVVFGAFMLSGDRMLQQFGLGLAVAVLLDAVVIRCLLLPAIMQFFGRAAWWLPRPLARVLPRIALERS